MKNVMTVWTCVVVGMMVLVLMTGVGVAESNPGVWTNLPRVAVETSTASGTGSNFAPPTGTWIMPVVVTIAEYGYDKWTEKEKPGTHYFRKFVERLDWWPWRSTGLPAY